MDQLFIFLFTAVGVVALLGLMYGAIMSLLAKKWHIVTGYLDQESFFTSEDDDGALVFHAKVKYHYQFKQKHFRGKRLAFGLYSSHIENLVLKPYIEATSVSPVTAVYVNPKNPKTSVLVVGLQPFHVFGLLYLSLWNALIIYFVWMPQWSI